MIDELQLLSGNDIPIMNTQLIIHQPRLKEIAYITENRFWIGCELLKFDKENLPDKDKVGLSSLSNFDIIMSIIQKKDFESLQAKINLVSLLTLLFPNDNIVIGKKTIQLCNQQKNEKNEINNDNFQFFKETITEIFCLKSSEAEYNPSGDLAKRIHNKIMQGRQKRAQLAGSNSEDENISILSRYISILAVGEKKNINELMDYTVYQLMDEFTRFNLKLHYDTWVKYKTAGAEGLEEPEDWLKDVHSNSNQNQKNDDWITFVQ